MSLADEAEIIEFVRSFARDGASREETYRAVREQLAPERRYLPAIERALRRYFGDEAAARVTFCPTRRRRAR